MMPKYFLTSFLFMIMDCVMEIELFVAQYMKTDWGIVAVIGMIPKANKRIS